MSNGAGGADDLIAQSGRRFRTVGWAALAVLVLTGVGNLYFKPWMLRVPAFQVKAGLVVLALALSALHDFFLGPRAGRLPPHITGPWTCSASGAERTAERSDDGASRSRAVVS